MTKFLCFYLRQLQKLKLQSQLSFICQYSVSQGLSYISINNKKALILLKELWIQNLSIWKKEQTLTTLP